VFFLGSRTVDTSETSNSLSARRCSRRAFAAFTGALLFAGLLPAGCERNKSQPPVTRSTVASKLSIVVVDDPHIAAAIRQLKGEWETRQQGSFEVAEMTESDLFAAESLSADAVVYPSYCIGALAERALIAAVPEEVLSGEELDWRDIFEMIQLSETCWSRTTYAVPFGSPVLTVCYRADLFERFKRRPPETWAEYQELAEFFSRRENLGDA